MNELEMAKLPYIEPGTDLPRRGKRLPRLRRRERQLRREGSTWPESLDPYEPDGPVQNPLDEQDLAISSFINLKEMFPISRRLVLKNVLPWMLGFAALIVVYLNTFGATTLVENGRFADLRAASNAYALDEKILYGSAALILGAVFLYYLLQWLFFNYRIEGFRLVIQRGVVLIEEGSLPLLPIAEVYLRRDLLDFLLGLYQIHVAVPVESTKKFACVQGLNRNNAALFREFLSAQLSKQQVAAPASSTAGNVNGHIGNHSNAANGHIR